MDEHRKKALRELIDRQYHGSQAEFVTAAKRSKGMVSAWLSDTEPFGERAAAKLADELGLPERYFEQGADGTAQSDATNLNPRQKALLEAFDLMDEQEQYALLIVLHVDTSKIPETKFTTLRLTGAPARKRAPAKKTKGHGRTH